MYVNVMLLLTCCSSVNVAPGVLDAPLTCGSILSLLTPNKRCNRPETGFATACPSSMEAPACAKLCCGGGVSRAASTGSDVGGLPDPSRETISLNSSGGSE